MGKAESITKLKELTAELNMTIAQEGNVKKFFRQAVFMPGDNREQTNPTIHLIRTKEKLTSALGVEVKNALEFQARNAVSDASDIRYLNFTTPTPVVTKKTPQNKFNIPPDPASIISFLIVSAESMPALPQPDIKEKGTAPQIRLPGTSTAPSIPQTGTVTPSIGPSNVSIVPSITDSNLNDLVRTFTKKGIDLTASELKDEIKKTPELAGLLKKGLSQGLDRLDNPELLTRLRKIHEISVLERSIDSQINNNPIIIKPRPRPKAGTVPVKGRNRRQISSQGNISKTIYRNI